MAAVHRQDDRRAGISLLEVLISIGILAIGLVSALALIPAGRTQLTKAGIDDRAALLVPNAYTTMRTLGLFNVDALTWTATSTSISNPEIFDPTKPVVIREVASDGDVFGRSPTGSILSNTDFWTIETIDTEKIQNWHPPDPPPARISGSVPQLDDGSVSGRIITVTIKSGSTVDPPAKRLDSGTSAADGTWSVAVPNDPDKYPFYYEQQIHESGTDVGTVSNEPYRDCDIVATYETGTADPVDAKPNPSSYRQYGSRREETRRTGKAKITYVAPSNVIDRNSTPSQATIIPIQRLENVTRLGTGEIARSASTKIEGTLWRMELGTRRGTYEQDVKFANVDDAEPEPQAPLFPTPDITTNAGYAWLDGSGDEVPPTGSPGVPEIRQDEYDWYRFDVEAGDVLTVESEQSYPGNTDFLEPDGDETFPIYFNTTQPSPANRLAPEPGSGSRKVYSIPNDGYVITRAKLRPGLVNTFEPTSVQRNLRRNPTYNLTVELSRSDRVIVIDPLMATRLDKIISLNGGASRSDPHYLRRHRFADFRQTFAGSGTPRPFIIPRLNWQKFAAGDTDTMLAMAEHLFRDQDNFSIDLPANEDDAPAPRFDVGLTKTPVRRQAEGRMSWLLMIQPEDAGPVSTNWEAGRYFDVSMVVFQDRKLPPLVPDAPLEGEYPLDGQWSDLTGMLTITVPADGPTEELDEDDVRDLFRAGAWILLAPQTSYDSSSVESTQRLDWVRIQTARIEKLAAGGFGVEVLLESEPAATILYPRGRPATPSVSPLVVLAYQGVVAVVNKTMRLEP